MYGLNPLPAEAQKFRGGRAWFLRARQAWESIKSLAQLPKKLMSGGGLPPIFFPGQFPDIIYIIG